MTLTSLLRRKAQSTIPSPSDGQSTLLPGPQYTQSSQRIRDYVETFTRKLLSGEHYVVVMLRSEKLKRSILSTPSKVNSCIGGILSDWEEMRNSTNATKSLFFSDAGKYGSVTLHKPSASSFSKEVYNKMRSHLAVDDVNSVLKGMTNSSDSVQIAILHQQLAARASCVILIGYGSFQAHTLSIHAHLHRGKECYVLRGGNCKKKYVKRFPISWTERPYYVAA